MKTVVILSTDNLGMTVADMLNPREMKPGMYFQTWKKGN